MVNTILIWDQNCRESPRGFFFKDFSFFFLNFFKIHMKIWLSFFVSLGSVVLILLRRKEGRIFFTFSKQKSMKIKFCYPLCTENRERQSALVCCNRKRRSSRKRKTLVEVCKSICATYRPIAFLTCRKRPSGP